MDTSKVTRFEVIDDGGRTYVNIGCTVELDLQDDGQTLKAFVHNHSVEMKERLSEEIAKRLGEDIEKIRDVLDVAFPNAALGRRRP